MAPALHVTLGTNTNFALTITDGDSVVSFASAALINIAESNSFNVDLSITPASADTITVDLGVSGTASAADINGLGSIIILANNTTFQVSLDAVNDNIDENLETGVLALSNPSAGAALGATTTRNIEITDADVIVSFASTAGQNLTEADSTSLKVLINPPASNSFTLSLNASGSLTAADFTPASINIPASVDSHTFTLKPLMTEPQKAVKLAQ